jgi:hypothetical protein
LREGRELITRERIKEAVQELNELHHEFKHLGPVPKEEQEMYGNDLRLPPMPFMPSAMLFWLTYSRN